MALTELDTYGVGHIKSWTRNWDAYGVEHGIRYTRNGIHTELDALGVG